MKVLILDENYGKRKLLMTFRHVDMIEQSMSLPGGGHSNMKVTYKCLPENENRGHSV